MVRAVEGCQPLFGDRAFLGFYTDEMTAETAGPGRYRVRVTSGRASAEGVVEVREDPLMTRARVDWMTGAELD